MAVRGDKGWCSKDKAFYPICQIDFSRRKSDNLLGISSKSTNFADMESFAIYRMPYQKECRCVSALSGMLRTVATVGDIDDTPGFVIAPFASGGPDPIVLIEGSCPVRYSDPGTIPAEMLDAIDSTCTDNAAGEDTANPDRSDYSRDFARFHARLADGTFGKLVLSRRHTLDNHSGRSPSSLFAEACRRYPRCFIALFSTPLTGTWLVATPELLFDRHGSTCHTMALAGTMEYAGDPSPRWSDKNLREQQYVVTYIHDAIEPFAEDLTITSPATVRAALLVHLRSDFTFRLRERCRPGELLSSLHPTPAVCGVPASAAHDFIVGGESAPRSYYSGFCGPVNIDGATDLYVTLRCMRIRRNACDLYAGGGLLDDSTEDAEWAETEAKMHTMLNLLEK